MLNEHLIIWEPLSQQYVTLSMSENLVTTQQLSEEPQTHIKRDSFHRATTFSLFPNTGPQRTVKSKSLSYKLAPAIPQRVSSMSTRRKKNLSSTRPDLATFHRQSCQLFASLDGKLSPPPKYEDLSLPSSGSSTTGSPSNVNHLGRGSSVMPCDTRAASFDNLNQSRQGHDNATRRRHRSVQYPFNVANREQTWPRDSGNFEGVTLTDFDSGIDKMKKSRSYSQLSPKITSTQQIFWTSTETRQAEYAKIDKANSGLKGFVRKVVPGRWWKGQSRKKFYGEKNFKARNDNTDSRDQAVEEWIDATIIANSRRKPRDSDESSVRRFRMSIDLDVDTETSKIGVEEHVVQIGEHGILDNPVRSPIQNSSDTDIIDTTTNTNGLRRRLSRTFSTYFR